MDNSGLKSVWPQLKALEDNSETLKDKLQAAEEEKRATKEEKRATKEEKRAAKEEKRVAKKEKRAAEKLQQERADHRAIEDKPKAEIEHYRRLFQGGSGHQNGILGCIGCIARTLEDLIINS